MTLIPVLNTASTWGGRRMKSVSVDARSGVREAGARNLTEERAGGGRRKGLPALQPGHETRAEFPSGLAWKQGGGVARTMLAEPNDPVRCPIECELLATRWKPMARRSWRAGSWGSKLTEEKKGRKREAGGARACPPYVLSRNESRVS